MHIAFVSLGAFGHVNPTLSLVSELIKNGHRVTYFCTENFRKIIEPTGAKFVAMKSWMAENDNQSDSGDKKEENEESVAAVVPFLFLNEAGAFIEDVLKVLKEDKPDAIVHDFAGIAGTIAADVLGVPNVMIYTSYPSNDTYSVAEGFNVDDNHPLRQAANGIAQGFVDKYGCRFMSTKEIFDGHGDLNLVMMQKRLVPNNETFDDSFVFTGVQIGKRSTFGSWTKPNNGKPLVYSSLGTVFNWAGYYPILFDAVRDMDINVFVALGAVDPNKLTNIPENVEIGQMVPQLEILSQADVFITHAGMGGTGESIYYGVPMIAIPQMDEQAITARAIEGNGLGFALLSQKEVTSEAIKKHIITLLTDPSYKTKVNEFSEDMKSLGGAKASCDALIQFLVK